MKIGRTVAAGYRARMQHVAHRESGPSNSVSIAYIVSMSVSDMCLTDSFSIGRTRYDIIKSQIGPKKTLT